MKHVGRTLLLVGLALVPATTAIADPGKGDKVDAQSLMQSGVKLLDAGDYLGALSVFKTAFDRFPSSKILLNIGTTLKLLDREADAANAYQRYLDAKDADPKRSVDLQNLIDGIDKTSGRYDITVTPADAQITIDDDDWTHVIHGNKWRVPAGRHAIHVRREGYTEKTKSVQVAANEAIAIEIQLVAIPKPEATVIRVPVDNGLRASLPPEGPRSRFGAFAIGHFDIPHGGAALVGVTADITDRIEAQGAAIMGPYFGGYVGGSFAFLTTAYRPYVSAGVPIFVSNGVRYAVRGAGGLEFLVNRHIALVIEAGVEHTFNREMGIEHATLFIPAIGVVGRL